MKVVTKANSDRIAKFAFDYAVATGRSKVTAVHKANIMSVAAGRRPLAGDALTRRTCMLLNADGDSPPPLASLGARRAGRKMADGLFLKSCGEIAKEYSNVKYDSIIVDNCAMQVNARARGFGGPKERGDGGDGCAHMRERACCACAPGSSSPSPRSLR